MSEMIQVPDGWKVKKVSQISKTFAGGTPDRENSNYYNGNIPWVKSGEVNQSIISKTEETITQDGLNNSSAKFVQKETILVAMYGATAGKVALLNIQATTNQAVLAVPLKNDDIFFVRYMLEFHMPKLVFQAQGSGQPNLSKQMVDNMLLLLPEKKEQERIAKILSTLDKEIESTNRLIEKEKNIKIALMQELLTNGIDKNGQIRTKATHSYKESELGLIPDEWEVDFIENHTKIITGDKDTQDRLDDGIYPFYVRSQTIERINTYSFDGEAILTAGDGVGVGKVFHHVNERFDFHQRVYCIHDFSEKLDSTFFFEYFRTYFIEQVNKYSAKGSVDSVRLDMIALMNIPLPSVVEQKQIAKILTTQDKKIETEETNIAKLKELKKGVMNDLLSGKVRVKI
jgi:type I restriction enzyme S subunit